MSIPLTMVSGIAWHGGHIFDLNAVF